MLVHRQNNVLKSVNSSPEFAASYTVYVTPVGARVASAGSGTSTITVDAGHSFAVNDRFLRYRSSDGSTEFSTPIDSAVTATTLVWSSDTWTVSAGDLLFNLGPDTGTGGTPDYDAIPGRISSQPDDGDDLSNVVTTDSQGNYDYYSRMSGRQWELILDGSGAILGAINGVTGGNPGEYNIADFGAEMDGSTDDSSRAQAAITAAESEASAVFIPSGSTIWKGVTVSDSASIVGVGISSIILSTGDGSSSANRALSVDTSGATTPQFSLSDLCIRQNSNALSADGSIVEITSSEKNYITDVSIEGDSGSDLVSSGVGLSIVGCDHAELRGLRVLGHPSKLFARGVDIGNATASTCSNINFYGGFIKAKIGVQCAENATVELNNINFYGLKVVPDDTGNPVDGSIGLVLGSGSATLPAPGNAIDPASLTPDWWFEADDITDGDGTAMSFGLANKGSVGGSFGQDGSKPAPIVRYNALNGHKAIEHDDVTGTGLSLSASISVTAASRHTIVAVYATASTTGLGFMLGNSSASLSTGWEFADNFATADATVHYASDTVITDSFDNTTSGPDVTGSLYHIGILRKDEASAPAFGANYHWYNHDGTDRETSPPSADGGVHPMGDFFWVSTTADSQDAVQLVELYTYTRLLTDNEVDGVWQFLAEKYGFISGTPMVNSIVSGCTFEGCDIGIEMSGVKNAVVQGNEINFGGDSASRGILISSGASKVTVLNNRIDDPDDAGTAIEIGVGTSQYLVANNDITTTTTVTNSATANIGAVLDGDGITAYGKFKLPIDTDATRGAAGEQGRVIFNSDDGNLNVDDGTNWINVENGLTT